VKRIKRKVFSKKEQFRRKKRKKKSYFNMASGGKIVLKSLNGKIMCFHRSK
jgi:hypothetical protein